MSENKVVTAVKNVLGIAPASVISINERWLYVNKADEILASQSKKTALINWSIQEKMTGFKWYDLGTILDNPKLTNTLADLIYYLRTKTTIKNHLATRSGSKTISTPPHGDSKVNTYDTKAKGGAQFFNGDINNGIDIEFEFYQGATDEEKRTWFAQWKKTAERNKIYAKTKNGAHTAYLGHFKPKADEKAQAEVAVKNLSRLDLSVYVTDENAPKMIKWVAERLSLIGEAQGRIDPTKKFKFYPIFSLEVAFFDEQAKAKPFDTIFTDFIKQYRALSFKGKEFLLEPDGYVLFAYTHAKACRPLK